MRTYFVSERGEADARIREAEIAVLPHVDWKGRELVTIRCHGDYGRGPHDVNVPAYVLWSLIALEAFRCPFHRN